MSFITIESISKSYKVGSRQQDVLVLDDINLSIEEKEFLAFFGPNGCGKTTLLNIISGLLEPEKGAILVNGRSPKDVKVGYIFQNFAETLFPWKTCLDNIAFSMELSRSQ